MRRNSFVIFVPCFFLLFGRAGANAGSQPSAHELITESLRTLDYKSGARTINAMRFNIKLVTRDIVEGEHTGEPYAISIGTGAVAENFPTGICHIETNDAASGRVIRRELTVGSADQFETFSADVRVGGRLTLAAPGWEMRDPFRALKLGETAEDLRREPDEWLHESRQHVVSFTANRVRAKILLDARTKLITATETLLGFSHATSSEIAYNALGDIRERTEFMLWEVADGLRYPTQWDTYRDDVHLQTLTVDSALIINPAWDAHLVLSPDSLQQARQLAATDLNQIPLNSAVAGAPDPHRGIEEIAPGVVQIPGSWYTTLVEQDDGIVVIDAPISSGYSIQVLRESRRRFPHAPIKAVITSTAFFWHIGGVREYAAQHIPIYVLDGNQKTLRRILDAPHQLIPDTLALSPVRPIIRVVHSRLQIGRGRNRIIVMPISLATEPMLMTYIPNARLLHTGEMIQPLGPNGSLLHPESLLEVRESVLAEGLQVDRLIGMHMSPISWRDLESAVSHSQTQ